MSTKRGGRMRIYLIRHGSTAGNLEHRYVGVTDEELTADAVQELRISRVRYPVPDCVFTSPLKRCVQTAQILFPELQPEISAELRECTFGDFEYRNYQELQEDAGYQEWIDSGGRLAFPGGESREEFADRCCAAFEECCHQALRRNCDSAAFVVHGGTIMAILDRYSSPHREYFDWQTGNGQGYQGNLLLWEAQRTPADTAYVQEETAGSAVSGSRGRTGRGRIQIRDLFSIPQIRDPIGIEDQYVIKQNKKLRCGYTTGSCAAAAARAAAEMFLSRRLCTSVSLMTPGGIMLHLPVQGQRISADYAECAVRKYGGDDPDATDGLLIWVRAESAETGQENPAGCSLPQIRIDGGTGIGRVTKPGLEQPVGAAAINRVPREMINREVTEVCEGYEYRGTLRITVSAPEGVRIAKRTFNPHIGIEGGISILGTSGIVVPMSEEALLASIRLQLQQKSANGERCLLVTPGNYGADFIRRKELAQALDAERAVKCSNYVGETLEMAAELGFEGILFVAHIGKFVKVSGGIMNTHSAQADCRAELLAAQAFRAMDRASHAEVRPGESAENKPLRPGGDPIAPGEDNFLCKGRRQETIVLLRRLLAANTTEESVSLLQEAGILGITMEETIRRIQYHLQRHCQGRIRTEVVLFSSQFGYLGESDGAEAMMEIIAG